MLKRKISIILTIALALNMANGPIMAFASELQSQKIIEGKAESINEGTIRKFSLLNNENLSYYNEKYKVDRSMIKTITNNGGKYGSDIIDKAIDNNFSTHWETGKPNSDSFTNEVVIELTENTILDRIVYGARQSSSKGKGFAKKVEVYASTSETGDDFALVCNGEYTGSTGDIVEIKFKATEFRRVKFNFKEANQNWASASEFMLYKEDKVLDKMATLFTDDTKSIVSEAFNTEEKLTALENEVKIHPFYNQFKYDLEDARVLLENKKVEPTIAETSIFNLYENRDYNELFKMDNSNINSIKNNAGHYSSMDINKAIDGDVNTYWETNKSNSNNFKNTVEIEFKERVTLDRVVYGARQFDTKGFAEEFEIYGSNTSSGDTYNLVATGKQNRVSGLIEAKFDATEFKRLKFVYKSSNKNWATANEFVFYKQDKVADDIRNIFTNGLEMELKPGYDLNKLNDLETALANHPLKEELKITLDEAKKILNNEVEIKGTYWDLESRGNSIKESQKRKIWNFQDWQPTGYRVKPGDVINVYVDVAKGEPTPQLIFKQMDTAHNGIRSIELKQGKNTITIPEVEVDSIRPGTALGGVLYTVNPYTIQEQSREPKIRFVNLDKYPHFVKGVHNDTEVMKNLEDYVKALESDNTLPDVFEVFGDKSLSNVTATAALNFYKSSGKTPSYSADAQDDIVKETMKFWGFDNSSEIHSDFNFRYVNMLKNLSGGAYMNGGNGITGMRPEHEAGALNGATGWGFMHEMGHNFDTRNRLIIEVTNNILPLQFQRLTNIPTRLTDSSIYEERVYPKVIKADYENNEMYPGTDVINFQHIASLWQIALYDENFYPEFEKKFRETSERFGSINEVHNGWVKIASDVLKMDVSEHFERHGAKITAETKEYTSKYPKLDKKTWYVNDSIYLGGGAFTDTLDYSITDIQTKAEGNVINFKIDEENKKNTLGYEVYRDGELIGFTERNTFVDKTRATDTNHEYKIIAFDKTITGKGSASIKVFTPSMQVTEKVTLAIGEEFNPLDYVKATNYKNEDITSKIEVDNNVNISVKGKYNITYKVTDNDSTVTKNQQVEVVSQYDYLSDSEWESVETQYGTPRRNTNIKARVNGDIKDFEKGIGIHAKGKVVYNLEGKNYDNFEALLGVNMSIIAQNNSSISFKVIGDGVELASTKVLKHSDNAVFINIPVSGVKELIIEISDANDGNGSDHGIIASPKLTTNNAKPTLEIPKTEVTRLGLPIEDLKGEVNAIDAEDGDISSSVVVENNINFNKTGVYEVTYSVTDSDGNTTSKKRKIKVVDMNDSHYLSDIDWKSAVNSYGKATKDKSASGNTLRLTGEDGQVVSYEKGIGTHSTSTIIYDLTNTNYGYFTSYVGVDRQVYGSVGSVAFQVYLDNVMVYDSGRMNSRDAQKFIEVDLKGAKELKLVVTDGGNGKGSDHATFGDAKLHYANNEGVEVNRVELNKLIEEVKSIESENFTKESYDNLMQVNSKVIESLKDGYNQDEINKLVKELQDAKSALVSSVDYSELQTEVDKAKVLKEYLYTKDSWASFKTSLDKAEKILADKASSKKEVSEMVKVINSKIEELKIVKGTGSIGKGKDELELLVEKANKIKNISQVGAIEHKELLWNDFLENRTYAEEVLYEITEDGREVTSVYLFLEQSIKALQIIE